MAERINNISFTVLGGGNEIGANSFLIQAGNTNIILDCGLHPKQKGLNIFPNYELINDLSIDHLIITHAHNDHIGALPYFLKLFPMAKVHTTSATLSIAEITLSNTSYLMEREFKDVWDKSFLQYYTEETLNLIPMIIHRHNYNEKVDLSPELSFEFFDAGHLLGSAGILLNIEGYKIFFTGDINFRSQKLISSAQLPRHKVDALITECTNGALDTLPIYADEDKRLASFINDVSGRGGSTLIPVFALGKAQEMLKRVWDLMSRNRIPHLPIYYSPLSEAINRVYDDFNYTVPRIDKGYKLSEIPFNILRRDDISGGDFYKHPSIVLATSGMIIENTASYRIARQFLERSNFGIAVCGYCDTETPGYIIKNAKRYERIYLNKFDFKGVTVNCKIENFKYSAHSSREDILKMIDSLSPQKIFLVHGDEEAINKTCSQILHRFPSVKLTAPQKHTRYSL